MSRAILALPGTAVANQSVKRAVIAGLLGLLFVCGDQRTFGAPMPWMRMVNVGAATNGFNNVQFTNDTKKQFHDFTITLSSASGTTITTVSVGTAANLGDWDVDDNLNGMIDAGDTNDQDATPTRVARTARGAGGGGGGEPAAAGTSVNAGDTFELTVTLTAPAAALSKIIISATDALGGQVMDAVAGGLGLGFIDYGILNLTAFDPDTGTGTEVTRLAGVADVNNTGVTVTGVRFMTEPGQPEIIDAFAIDPATDAILGGVYVPQPGGGGVLLLDQFVPDQQLLGYEVEFASLSHSEFTEFNAQLIPIPEPTAAGLLLLGFLSMALVRPKVSRGGNRR